MAFVVVFMFVAPRLKEHNYIENPEDHPALQNQVIADTNNL
jgi:POT family proton-dependent oligopeptide transporter